MIISIAIIVVGVGFFTLRNKGGNNPSYDGNVKVETSTPTPELSTQDAGIMESGEVKTINVEAGSFYFKPNEIRVKKGEKVRIILASKDMMHDFNIDELGVSVPVTKAGDTSTAEFVANKTGEFEYYCSVGQHRKMGQVGKIIIE